jgi:gamma-glutamyl-gamma-aminobutyrate hydrolase PuuD
MKPIIGINLDIDKGPPPQASVQTTYYEAVQKAGGIPILLPPMLDADLDDLLEQIHGLLLIGGLDYAPDLYGESTHPSCELLNPVRQDFDLRLVRRALTSTSIPVLGICGGCQLLNISLGGSLIQDIKTAHPDSSVVHSKPDGWREGFARHPVLIDRGSILGSIYGMEQVDVPTSHHQAIKALGAGLRVTARAEDGIIEAVEMESRHFTVGVQWHPERDFAGNERLFKTFVQKALDSRN